MTIPEEGEISMQFVKTADLKPGMRLAKPIYNRMGVLLYERDTRLTIQGINSIENFGLIGIFILEPAEPLPPLSREDLEFEQFQTIYMFKLKDNMDKLVDNLVQAEFYADTPQFRGLCIQTLDQCRYPIRNDLQ